MAEESPNPTWYEQAAGARDAAAIEQEKVTQKALFARVMFLVAVTCGFTAAGAFIAKDFTGGWMIACWIGAIALVFAIFQLNPAPFCLLDEVDAPLDDANTERYAKLVSSMSKGTQFLFISHNKIAM